MALQMWLPLNGDLHNQGLSNVIATNNGATINNNGKIGKCYKTSIDGSINLNYNGNQINNTSFSFGGWFKFNQSEISAAISGKTYTSSAIAATGNLIGNNNYGGISLQWQSNNMYANNNFSSISVCSYLRTSTNGARATSFFTLPFDTWVHIFLTYDKIKNLLGLWINGQLKYTSSQVAFTDAPNRNLTINFGSIAGGNGPSAKIPFLINDVRIYDHALSAKEVEEIARGLVLHYKLDSYEIEFTNNICSSLVKGGRTNIVNNTVQNTGENADTYWYIKPKEALVGGATYTVSCNLSGFSTPDKFIQWGVGSQSGDNCAGYWRTYNGYNSFTFIMPAGKDGSTANFIFDDNGGTRTEVFTLSNIQLEKKDQATPFVGYGKQHGAQYDPKIYIEPDGSKWLHIAHHNNPSSSGYFNQTDPWTTGVYLNEDKWYDVNGVIDQISTYEFMVKQKTTSSGSEAKYRWVQNKNPLIAVYNDVKPGTVVFNTSTGYTNSTFGGLWQMNSSARLCIANATAGNWYGAFGCWATFQTNKVPGFPNSIIDTGYMDLYVRIDGTNLGKIYDCSGYNNNGTMVGSLTAAAGSPRYGIATHLESSSPTTNNNTGLTYIQSSLGLTAPTQMSVCWWGRPESGYGGGSGSIAYHAAWCTSALSGDPSDYNRTAFHHRDSKFDICLDSASSTSLSLAFNNYTLNEWHYYCVTYDGKIAILYKDGIETNRSTISSTEAPLKTFTKIVIGFSKAGSVWRKTLGSYSDFRVYVTALSAAAVKELYTTSLKIVSGNPVARELSEL